MAYVTRLPGGILRHGYTLDDLDRIAHAAARVAVYQASDIAERYDTAWSAIAEALYVTELAPPEHDLFNVGRNAIWRELQASLHCRGVLPAGDGGYRTMAAYDRYWRHHARAVPSPENTVVDRVAVWQIMPRLTSRQREALGAYVAHGYSLPAAAEALQVGDKTLSGGVDRARAAFLALWHEHETPSRKWRKDGTRRRDELLVSCGTNSAYFRHRRRGEEPCEACWEAHRRDTAATKARRRAGLTTTRALAPCGTAGAYRRHKRRGEPIDHACNQARPRRKQVA